MEGEMANEGKVLNAKVNEKEHWLDVMIANLRENCKQLDSKIPNNYGN